MHFDVLPAPQERISQSNLSKINQKYSLCNGSLSLGQTAICNDQLSYGAGNKHFYRNEYDAPAPYNTIEQAASILNVLKGSEFVISKHQDQHLRGHTDRSRFSVATQI